MYSNIFINLGSACNFNCRYCMQHHLDLDVSHIPRISDKFLSYLLDYAKKAETKTNIQLWGGEPLLYWDTLKDIVLKLSPTDKFTFGIITNGSLLDLEKVKFLNEYNINVAISHDGYVTEKTRNSDVFQDSNIKDCFLKLKNKSISAVMSALNMDFYSIFNYFKDNFDELININIDLIYDTNLTDRDLVNFDFDKLSNYIDTFLENAYKNYQDDNVDFFETYEGKEIQRYLPLLNWYANNPDCYYWRPHCGTMLSMLNTDLNGNIYLCHNSSIKFKDVFTATDEDIFNAFSNYNKYVGSDKCQNCDVLPLCSGGCILLEDKGHELFCKIKKMYYGKIIDFVLKFKDL